MNHYKKTYENVFSEDHKGNTARLNINKISTYEMELDKYIPLFHNFLKDFYDDLFLNCVKLSWLRRKFTLNGNRVTIPIYNNARGLQNIFVKFIRRYIGHDIQVITKGNFFSKLETSYFDILFPDFNEENPFENPEYYKFPYENISLEYLTVLYQLDDRIELLKEADKQKMSYAVFLDYIINHILNENERLGRDRYLLTQNIARQFPYYVRDMDKHLKPLKGTKRICKN